MVHTLNLTYKLIPLFFNLTTSNLLKIDHGFMSLKIHQRAWPYNFTLLLIYVKHTNCTRTLENGQTIKHPKRFSTLFSVPMMLKYFTLMRVKLICSILP